MCLACSSRSLNERVSCCRYVPSAYLNPLVLLVYVAPLSCSNPCQYLSIGPICDILPSIKGIISVIYGNPFTQLNLCHLTCLLLSRV